MPHVRTQIRNAAIAALTGLPSVGTKVSGRRVATLRDADLPCLVINTEGESVSLLTMQKVLERKLRLVVRAVVKTTASLDDTLDQILSEIEPALAGSTFGGLCKPIVPAEVDIEDDDALDQPVGVLAITYQVPYFTAAAQPGTPL